MPIDMDMLVDDVMRRHPATVRTFMAHKMACIGCPIGGFHTIADACREHGVDAIGFLAALHAVIDGAAAAPLA